METSRKTLLRASTLFFLILVVSGTDVEVKYPVKDSFFPSEDPPEIVGKALACFDHPDTCKPEQRLSPSGSLDVPPNETDEYCNGGCYDQTQLVLTCIDQILSNFEFYNKATIDDINITITEACSNTDKRGDFNVTERMESTSSDASNGLLANFGSLTIFVILYGLLSIISLIML